MPMLSPEKLFQIWEAGVDRPPLARTVALLRAAGPVGVTGDPAALPMGRRDRELLALREEAFGGEVSGVGRCPDCAEQIEVLFQTGDVRVPAVAPPESLWLESEGYRIRFHLPSSADLLAIEAEGEEQEIVRRILEHSVSESTLDGAPVAAAALPEPLQEAIATAMAAADPQAEIELSLRCPACSREWTEVFDIESFFWIELQAWAARTLREIHQLASAYGWNEGEILALPPSRRTAYLKLIEE